MLMHTWLIHAYPDAPIRMHLQGVTTDHVAADQHTDRVATDQPPNTGTGRQAQPDSGRCDPARSAGRQPKQALHAAERRSVLTLPPRPHLACIPRSVPTPVSTARDGEEGALSRPQRQRQLQCGRQGHGQQVLHPSRCGGAWCRSPECQKQHWRSNGGNHRAHCKRRSPRGPRRPLRRHL